MKKLLSSSPFVLRVDENDVRTKLLAGGCSGALAAILLNPTELVKTRRMKGDSWQAIQAQVSKDGVSSLWRGCSMAASRAAILTASQVAAYGEVKRAWMKMVPNAKDDWTCCVGVMARSPGVDNGGDKSSGCGENKDVYFRRRGEVDGERGGNGGGE